MQLSSALKALAVAAALGFSAQAGATTLNGSATIGSAGANETGQTLLARTSFTVNGAFIGNTSGDFNGTPTLSSPRVVNPTPVTIGGFDLNSPTSFSVHSSVQGQFGTFTASSFQQITRRADFLDGMFSGTFTPDKPGVVDAFDAGSAVLRISLTRSIADGNATVSFGGTLAVTPDVPEPASMALLGVGLLGLGLARRTSQPGAGRQQAR